MKTEIVHAIIGIYFPESTMHPKKLQLITQIRYLKNVLIRNLQPDCLRKLVRQFSVEVVLKISIYFQYCKELLFFVQCEFVRREENYSSLIQRVAYTLELLQPEQMFFKINNWTNQENRFPWLPTFDERDSLSSLMGRGRITVKLR